MPMWEANIASLKSDDKKSTPAFYSGGLSSNLGLQTKYTNWIALVFAGPLCEML